MVRIKVVEALFRYFKSVVADTDPRQIEEGGGRAVSGSSTNGSSFTTPAVYIKK